jgi:hypothetical protein
MAVSIVILLHAFRLKEHQSRFSYSSLDSFFYLDLALYVPRLNFLNFKLVAHVLLFLFLVHIPYFKLWVAVFLAISYSHYSPPIFL